MFVTTAYLEGFKTRISKSGQQWKPVLPLQQISGFVIHVVALSAMLELTLQKLHQRIFAGTIQVTWEWALFASEFRLYVV